MIILITITIEKFIRKKKDLSKSEVFGNNFNSKSLNTELDVPDYLDDFLQHSRNAVFITGNENTNSNSNSNKPIFKKKKIIKKIIKKKKISSNDINSNHIIINNTNNTYYSCWYKT